MHSDRHRRSIMARLAGTTLCLMLVSGCQPGAWRLLGRPHEPETFALLVNGGGRREVNYQSHLTHIKSVVELLRAGGVPQQHIYIFSSDGDDPEADLATREQNPEQWSWLLPQAADRLLRPPVTYVDSAVDGFELQPANRSQLKEWFKKRGRRLRPGDTLFFYVTDHGQKNKEDLTNNTISLWNDSVNVDELRTMFGEVNPGVNVVMLMSQCFSGSFAHTILATADGATPGGNVCGYFASTAERPAYGCYPENRGKDGVGHSHRFFQATEQLGGLSESHQRVLVTDDTPDVPHTTTDFFLDQILKRAAKEREVEETALADEMIAQAWQTKGQWEPEIRLLDRIGQTFGIFSPRSLAELQQQADVMPMVSKQLGTYEDRWREALQALALENLQRFALDHPEWKDRLDAKALGALSAEERSQTATTLLAELVPYTQRDEQRYDRLLLLRQRMLDAGQARYRMEVRLGVVLRMRSILTSIAGRVYLADFGTAEEQMAFERLAACEDFAILAPPAGVTAASLEQPERFPPWSDDQKVVDAVMPAWMGIRYRPLSEEETDQAGASVGAVQVMTVFPDSPADAAGLKVGDLILGPPGHPFDEPNQIREWTMRHEIGTASPIQLLREKRPVRVTLHPGPYPLEMPELPGPPKVGDAAPPLNVEPFRGEKELAASKESLLFFWATWCLPCKSSLPEVMAFAQARGVDVVAITDEPADKLEDFFGKFDEPFPEIVVTDRYRSTFQSYGVSGTPTFVLVDAEGVVRHYQTGYNRKLGLGIGDWHWDGAEKEVSDAGGK